MPYSRASISELPGHVAQLRTEMQSLRAAQEATNERLAALEQELDDIARLVRYRSIRAQKENPTP